MKRKPVNQHITCAVNKALKNERTLVIVRKYYEVLSVEEENRFTDYLITASCLHYGLTKMEVRFLVYPYALANLNKFPITWEQNKKIGKE